MSRKAEYMRTYYAANRASMLATCKDWNKRNPDARRDIRSRWKLRNPDKLRVRGQVYTATWLKRNPDKKNLHRAKKILARQVGCKIADVPNDLAEAKAAQLRVTQLMRANNEKEHGTNS